MEDKDKKILQTLEAIKHPENFSQEELDVLLSDKECVEICQDLLDSREAFCTSSLHSAWCRSRMGILQIETAFFPSLITFQKEHTHITNWSCIVNCSLHCPILPVASIRSFILHSLRSQSYCTSHFNWKRKRNQHHTYSKRNDQTADIIRRHPNMA